ncbi:hypothetical protein [Nonomuraea dietziae]|uniref:hypothetical protein n=1 Tax=Nonomuraea dietziae TaxID=65515 RepID=UPI0031E1244B
MLSSSRSALIGIRSSAARRSRTLGWSWSPASAAVADVTDGTAVSSAAAAFATAAEVTVVWPSAPSSTLTSPMVS